MILLQSQDAFDRMALLDGPGGELHWITRDNAPPQQIQGHCSKLGNSTLCLYRSSQKLYFRLDDQDIELLDDAIVTWTHGLKNVLSVVRAGKHLLTFEYPNLPIEPPLEDDPTPMVEMEDYDFGLFVANVTQDPERRSRIYTLSQD